MNPGLCLEIPGYLSVWISYEGETKREDSNLEKGSFQEHLC